MHSNVRRRVVSFAAALALGAGVLTAVGGTAHAAVGDPLPSSAVEGGGLNYGFGVEFEEPANPAGITGYQVGVVQGTDASQPALKTEELVPADGDEGLFWSEFDGLTAGVTYVGYVVVHYGDTDSPRTATQPDIAYKPIPKVRNLTLTPGNKSMSVRWNPPVTSALTSSVELYGIAISTGSAYVDFEIVEPPAKSVRFTGLTNGRRYTVNVQALGADLGAVAAAVATPIGSPAKPKSLKRTWKKGGKTKLAWSGAPSTVAAPVTGYVVYVNGKKVATLAKTARSYTVKGQKKGKKYSFSVRAKNSVGFSSAAKLATKKRPIS